MSEQMSVEKKSSNTDASNGSHWNEDIFPVKKTTIKARIQDGIIHSPYPDFEIPPVSLFALLAERMQNHGDKTAILFQEQAFSHRELLRRFRCMTAGLQAMGLGKGDRVYTRFCGSTVDGLVALCGVMFSGATLILVSDFNEAEHMASIRSLDVTHLLVDSATATRLRSLLPHLKLKGKLSVDEVPGFSWVSPFQWANEATFRDGCGHQDKVMLLGYSSGTSGAPKNIEIRQRSLLYCLLTAEASEILTAGDVCTIIASVCKFIGLINHLSGLYTGATFLMMGERERFNGLLDAITRHKVTWFMSHPHRVLELARKVKERSCGPPTSLKRLLVTGSPLSAIVAREIESTLQPQEFRNFFGITETCGRLTVPPKGEFACGNVGFPVSGSRVKVIDMGSGTVLGPMKLGEVLAHSPGIMKGYYNLPAETDAVLDAQGWYHTGDIGYYDQDGRLYLVDREKFTLLCFGFKVSPCELEDCLLGHPDVCEAAVLGVRGGDAGDAPAAIVVPRPDCKKSGEELARELKALIAEQLSWYKHLHGGVYISDAIPKTDTGKVRRRELPELIRSLRRVDKMIAQTSQVEGKQAE